MGVAPWQARLRCAKKSAVLSPAHTMDAMRGGGVVLRLQAMGKERVAARIVAAQNE